MVHLDGVDELVFVLEDEVGDDGENAGAFGLDDVFPTADDDGCLVTVLPIMMKNMK